MSNKNQNQEQQEKSVLTTLVAAILAMIGLDESGKLTKFFKREIRKFTREITMIKQNIAATKMEYKNSLTKLKEDLEDAVAAVTDAYKNVDIDAISTNAGMDEFSRTYWAGIIAAEKERDAIEDAIKELEDNHKEYIKTKNAEIASLQVRIDYLQA